MILLRNSLIWTLLGSAFVLLAGCEPLTDVEGEKPQQGSFVQKGETVSHGWHKGVTPKNIDPDVAFRVYPVVDADWEGPGGDSRWLGMNLGAVRQADSVGDERPQSAGWYFKFNRKQGYYSEGTGYNLVDHFQPELTRDYPAEEYNTDWIEDDPCTELLGEEWRIPTAAEWLAAGEAGADLNLHNGGLINGFTGFILDYRGRRGNYWSSDQYLKSGAPVYRGIFVSLDPEGKVERKDHIIMATGLPVRCIAE